VAHTKPAARSRSPPCGLGSMRRQPLGAGPAPLVPPIGLPPSRLHAPRTTHAVGGRTGAKRVHPGSTFKLFKLAKV
jgi:hypothetical protein